MKTGIWLDSDNAYILKLEGEDENYEHVVSEVEHFHAKGGYGSSQKNLPQDAVSESALQNRKDQQLKKYFHEIFKHISDSSELIVMGPGETKIAFGKQYMGENTLKGTITEIIPSDKMTENQFKSKVKDFFGKK